MKWGPRKPKERIKVVECGTGRWDDRGLDYPHQMVTTNFKITGDGHRRIESIYTDCRDDRDARELLDAGELWLIHRPQAVDVILCSSRGVGL